MSAAEEWRALAVCAQTGPAIFHPSKGEPSAPAKRICMTCDVRVQCLEFAMLTEDQYGVFGGLTARERLRLRRQRRAGERAA